MQALVFTSGYVANDATLQALRHIIPEIVFISDECNHLFQALEILEPKNIFTFTMT